jgi:hypothetical protein
MINTKVHGVLDYATGMVLLISPWLFRFAAYGIETWFTMIMGAAIIAYSLCTDYELSVTKKFSMYTHLGLDIFSGVLLAASPLLLGFHEVVYLPQLIIGCMEVLIALFTVKESSPGRKPLTAL